MRPPRGLSARRVGPSPRARRRAPIGFCGRCRQPIYSEKLLTVDPIVGPLHPYCFRHLERPTQAELHRRPLLDEIGARFFGGAAPRILQVRHV